MRNILKLYCLLLLFSCETDDFKDANQNENVFLFPQPKVQLKQGNQVSKKAINFIKMRTNNAFTIAQSKSSITFSQNSFLSKTTELGIIDTGKEIVVHNDNSTKHTFKVITPYDEENEITNVIIVEKEETTYEYFLKYIFEGEIPYKEDGVTIDFSKFNGTIETYNSNGNLIGSITIENGIVLNDNGDLAPCPTDDDSTEPEPSDDTTSSNDSGSDAGTGIPGGTDEEVPSYYDNTGNGGEFVDPDNDCSVSWSFTDCGCGIEFADGHPPSGNACCGGSVLVMRDCNGAAVAQRNSTEPITMFKRNSIDPCDDGDVGVLLDDDDCDTSKEDLQKIFPDMTDDDATLLAKMINDKGVDFGIDTKEKLWHFLAQAGHETGGFTDLNVTESTYWTTASRMARIYSDIFTMDSLVAVNDSTKYFAPDYLQNSSGVANIAMCCKFENGDVASGDGYKYRGRGIFQLTWKENYRKFKEFYNDKYDPDIDVVASPSEVATNDTLAILSGMWYYKARVLDKITIDSITSVRKVTYKINKARAGIKDRKKRFKQAKDSIDCLN